MQSLMLMHKINLGTAPSTLLKLFNPKKPCNNLPKLLSDHQSRRLNRLGINQNNVIQQSNYTTTFFEETSSRLNTQK